MPAWLVPILVSLAAHYGPAILSALGIGALALAHRFVKNKKLNDALDWLYLHVGPVVAAVEQTYVDSIKNSGGFTLTNGEKAEALRRAIEAVLAQIPAEYRTILEKNFPGDKLEALIRTLVESKVKSLSMNQSTVRANEAGADAWRLLAKAKFIEGQIPGLSNPKDTSVPVSASGSGGAGPR